MRYKSYIQIISHHRLVFMCIGVVMITVFIYVYLLSDPETQVAPQTVTISSVVKADIAHSQSLTGTIAPIREVDISAKEMGTVTRLDVDLGSRVESGDRIARLDMSTAETTQQSLNNSIAATQATVNATKDLYATRIASMDTSDGNTGDTAGQQTSGVTLVTNVAVLTKQIDDMLGTLFSVRGGKTTFLETPFDTELGATDSRTKTTVVNELEEYQKNEIQFQQYVSSNIVGAQPDQSTVRDGLTRSVTMLSSAQTVLKDAYTVLAASVASANLPATQIDSYKSQVANFGTQSQQILSQIHDVTTGISTLKKESDTQVAAAQSQLTQLQGQAAVNESILADGTILVPFDGVVTKKYVESGAVVSMGMPIVHIADDSSVKVVVGIPDDVADTIMVGDHAIVTVDGMNTSLGAQVTKVSPTIDPTTRKISVELTIDNTDHTLTVGSYAHVLFSQAGATTLAVPRSAVVSRYGTSFVFVLDGLTVHRRTVVTGAVSDTLVEIVKGLSDGEIVVTSGNDYLREGDTVATSSRSVQ